MKLFKELPVCACFFFFGKINELFFLISSQNPSIELKLAADFSFRNHFDGRACTYNLFTSHNDDSLCLIFQFQLGTARLDFWNVEAAKRFNSFFFAFVVVC